MERCPQRLKEGSRDSLLGLSYRIKQCLKRLVAHIQIWWAAAETALTENDWITLQDKYLILQVYRCKQHMLLHFPLPLHALSLSHTVGHSVIRDSTFTDEKRSHKELGAKWHANKEELKKSLPSLTNYLVNYKPLWRAPTVDGLSDYTVHLSPLSTA